MTIDATTSLTTTSALTTGTAVSTAKQSMDSEMFMTLLVAQLQNQDPSSPMDTNEMMSQQVQMAQMEQTVTQTSTIQEQFALMMRMAALGVVGQQVSYYDSDGSVVTGQATSASFAASVPAITIGDASVSLDSILSVNAANAASDSTTSDSTASTADATSTPTTDA
ncbi:flagellar hook assembly protein FlgD [Demequina capsici]|uniref:Flagellar hook capping FlgD N-terminal domain-containing protein n=1 Tax=Demequina capsici TaxID=3075620 RepID=A0AA96F827_9MICO|nr:flagellar hook capping FlgD N-terminal domain-containing protein [Demequina sp. OYTSA14]WNM24557.1 flagellar hook capping FlgD N-terminal domain-containing protein [Demequina sp. OYTSA14]